MNACFERLTAWLAPICVFTMEEAWRARYGDDAGSVHLRQVPETPASWRDEALADKWEKLRRLRRAATGALEVERREKRIGASLEAAPIVYVADEALRGAAAGADLMELFITGAVRLEAGEGPADAFRLDDAPDVAVVVGLAGDLPGTSKCARCGRYTDEIGVDPTHPHVCARCADAVGRTAK